MTRALFVRGSAMAVSVGTLVFVGTSPLAILAAIGGVVAMAVGVRYGWRLPITTGAVCLCTAVVVAGRDGAAAVLLVAGAITAVLAWDFGTAAVDLTAEYDSQASVTRLELAHVAGGVVLFGGIGSIVFLLSRLPTATARPIAPVLLLVGGVLLASAIR